MLRRIAMQGWKVLATTVHEISRVGVKLFKTIGA